MSFGHISLKVTVAQQAIFCLKENNSRAHTRGQTAIQRNKNWMPYFKENLKKTEEEYHHLENLFVLNN